MPEQLPRAIRLTRRFYEWERRARGWRIWHRPVDLEPPFERLVLERTGGFFGDDGRRETSFSRFFGGRQLRVDSDESGPDDEPLARRLSRLTPTIALQALAPNDFRPDPEAVAQLLLSLGPRSLLSFEVLASGRSSSVQFVCPPDDAANVWSQLQAHLPSLGLRRAGAGLDRLVCSGTKRRVVDFGLDSEFFLPLRTLSSFDVDPLSALFAALDDLASDEAGLLQILFQPTQEDWAAETARALFLGTDASEFFLDAPEFIRLAGQKLSRPLFSVAIRVVTAAPTEDRAWEIAQRLGGALGAMRSAEGNSLIPLANDDYPDDAHWEDVVARRSRRSGMLLNVDELVTLVHPPSASVVAPHLERLTRKTKPVGQAGGGRDLVLGHNEHQGQTSLVGLRTNDRIRHTYVIGVSGTGKSTLLLNMMVQDLEAGHGFALLDPHGDLVEQLLERIPDDRLDDVVLLDAGDEGFPVGFNILQARSDAERTLLASDLVEAFRRLSSTWGDQMTSVLANAILAFLESSKGGTLADLRRFLVEPEYREQHLKTVQDPEVLYYWRWQFGMLTGRPQAPLLTRLDTFLRPKLIRAMVSQQHDRLDFRWMMDSRKVFLAKLTQGAIGEENSYLLGTLLVTKLHQAALARQSVSEAERTPFFLYVDEFHNFVTPSLASILSGARKFGLGLVLSHQELRQVSGQSADVASAVIANPFARICFRLGDDDAKRLRSGFSFFDEKDLQNLGVGEAIVRLGRAEHDFNLKTQPPSPPLPGVATRRDRIVARCRERYAKPRQQATDKETADSDVPPVQRQPKKFGPPKS